MAKLIGLILLFSHLYGNGFRIEKLRIRPTVRWKTEKALSIVATVKMTIKKGFAIFSISNSYAAVAARGEATSNK